jgi:tRNA(fMet)-specific endonuclease VapC
VKYLLDTNACIAYLTGRSQKLRERLKAVSPTDIALCSVVKAELLFGAFKSTKVQDNLAGLTTFFAPLASVPFDDQAAEIYGRVRAHLHRQGTPIGPNDLLIAAIAVAHDLTLVTRNGAEFARVADLCIENWETP